MYVRDPRDKTILNNCIIIIISSISSPQNACGESTLSMLCHAMA